MRAFQMQQYGGPEVTRVNEIDPPEVGPGELLITVCAAGLNPVDFKTRDGALKPIFSLKMPCTLGNELSGTVRVVGEGVSDYSVGDRIISRVDKGQPCAFAEQAVIAAETATHAPATIPLTDAAALPLAGLTALQALRDELGVQPGQQVLITGGAGGVGTYAIQIAKWLGAEVTTTASPRGRSLVERMGADHIIDYTTSELADVDRKFDAIFDLIGGDTLKACFALAKPGRTVLSVAGMPEPVTASKDLKRGFGLKALFWLISFGLRRAAARHKVTYRYLFMHPSGQELAELVNLVDAGTLEVIVDRHFEFEHIQQAIAYLEDGHAKGKVVVTINKDETHDVQ